MASKRKEMKKYLILYQGKDGDTYLESVTLDTKAEADQFIEEKAEDYHIRIFHGIEYKVATKYAMEKVAEDE